MALSEIEKLERRYAENPQGLTFAPLAEVHRKNGEVQRALDLLGPGLQHHPDYIPASIVLGRCHMDLGNVHAAESAFLHVLELDGENVIALKALADICERLLKFDDAERWLHSLLTVDRGNDEAREQLQRVEISRRQAEVASSADPSVVAPQAASEMVEPPAAPEVSPIADISPPHTPFEPPVAEPAVGWVSQSGQAEVSSPGLEELEPSALREPIEEPAEIRLDSPVPFDEPVPLESVEPIDGLVGREVDTPDEELGEFRVETSEDIILQSAGGSEFQMPDASQELFAHGTTGGPPPFEEDAPIPPHSVTPEPPAIEPSVLEPVMAEPPAHEQPAAEQAAAEQPAAEQAAPEPVTDVSDWRNRHDAPPVEVPSVRSRRSYGVAETGGRSVAQLFKGILSARPPAQASAPPVRQAPPAGGVGAPTRPAADSLSLSSVFGEETSSAPPAVPAPNAGGGSVSFDDFFGPSSAAPARAPRAPDPRNDDLDQFHAWLQNLKR